MNEKMQDPGGDTNERLTRIENNLNEHRAEEKSNGERIDEMKRVMVTKEDLRNTKDELLNAINRRPM